MCTRVFVRVCLCARACAEEFDGESVPVFACWRLGLALYLFSCVSVCCALATRHCIMQTMRECFVPALGINFKQGQRRGKRGKLELRSAEL